MRRRLRVPLAQLGQVRELRSGPWIWECWILPCSAITERRPEVPTQEAAEDALIAHLRDSHDATGGELRKGRTRALKRLAEPRPRNP